MAIGHPEQSLCGNLDICLNYHANAYFQSRNSVRVTESRRCFFKLRFLVAFLNSLADFTPGIYFSRKINRSREYT